MNQSIEGIATALYHGVGLAPMVRASTTPLRTLAIKYGADFVYTEELIDRSITSSIRVVNDEMNTIDYIKDPARLSKRQQRKLQDDFVPALFLRIDRTIEKHKLICQIGSGEPELAMAAALHVHQDIDAIDLNMGCPKKFSVSGGMGSALLSDPTRACTIIRTLVETMKPFNKPVSAKIRLLKDTSSTVDFISGLVNAGVNAVAVHGRRVGDRDINAADWKSLEEVVSITKGQYPHIPILLNGDFYTRDDFTTFQKKTGANGVLLGRPALYNTSIFRKPSNWCSNNHDNVVYGYDSPLLFDKTTVIQDYLKESIKYGIHYKNVKYVLCEMMNSRRAPMERLAFLPQEFPGGQTIGRTASCHTLQEMCQLWHVNYDDYCSIDNSTTTTTLPAGDHIYSDSYLLQNTTSVVVATSASDGTFHSKNNDKKSKFDFDDDVVPETSAKRIRHDE
jgi:tRNA-dihydrouridine synthase 2